MNLYVDEFAGSQMRVRILYLLSLFIVLPLFSACIFADETSVIDQIKVLIKETEGANLVLSETSIGSKSFLNRDYVLQEFPEELAGQARYSFDGGSGTKVIVRFQKPAVVFAVFEYNKTGLWSFEDQQPPQNHGWHLWRAEAFRGSSNLTSNGRTNRAAVWYREFKAGEDLRGLPPWWLCLGILDLDSAKQINGFQAGLFTAPPPSIPDYSHLFASAKVRNLSVPVFQNQDEIRFWQQGQRKLFLDRMAYPYQGEISIIPGKIIDRVTYQQQVFQVHFDGNKLFRYFRLQPQRQTASTDFPVVVCFMGHGKVTQILDDQASYQHACAAQFAKAGYLVYAMENIGMEPGQDTHLDLDRILRLEGYGWYSLLFAHQKILLEKVFSDPMAITDRVGVTGVSTGGLLALSAAAMEPRVAAASVQGIFGSMRVGFIRDRNQHCSCGAIPHLLPEFDLPEQALLVAPRPLQIVNAANDGFSADEADRCAKLIDPIYTQSGGDSPVMVVPPGGHAYAFDPALEFFEHCLKQSGPEQERNAIPN